MTRWGSIWLYRRWSLNTAKSSQHWHTFKRVKPSLMLYRWPMWIRFSAGSGDAKRILWSFQILCSVNNWFKGGKSEVNDSPNFSFTLPGIFQRASSVSADARCTTTRTSQYSRCDYSNRIVCDVTDPTPQTYVVDIIVLVLQAVDTTDLISVLWVWDCSTYPLQMDSVGWGGGGGVTVLIPYSSHSITDLISML